MDWDRAQMALSDPSSVPGRIFRGVQKILARRAAVPEFHASNPTEVLNTGNSALFALARHAPFGSVVCIYNFTESWTAIPVNWAVQNGATQVYELLSDTPIHDSGGAIPLPPHARVWLR
jgi:amylosucrase